MFESRKSLIGRSFAAAAIVVAGPVLGLAGLAGSASAVPAKAAVPTAAALPASTPAPAALGGIACPSATFCMAVGGTSASMPTGVAAQDWTGAAWHRLAITKPGGVANVGLSAVSCPSATECVAVGSGTIKGGDWVPVAETWTRSGGWKVGKPVLPGGDGNSMLSSISCPSTSLCFAAGTADEFAAVVADQLPLVERWTPRAGWARVKLPPAPRGSSDNALNGISCETSTQCAAVGTYTKGSTQFGLIVALKKTTWTVSTAPKSANGILYSVSCPSASLCVAVGSLLSGHNLAERWSGGTWTQSAPVAAGRFPGLVSVSCAASAHCVALGGSTSVAFVDTLTGTAWKKTAQTGPGFKVGELNDISCFSTSTRSASCALLGASTATSATARPLSAFLTAGKWKVAFTV